MTRKPTRRIEFTVPEELGERYDKARGHIPMATWIKAVLADDVAAAEETIEYLTKTGQSSADAKRAVRPIPKGKR